MAVIAPSRYDLKDTPHLEGYVWSSITNGDTGRPIKFRGYRDIRVMFYDDFASGTAVLQGTDDPRGNPDHPDHASAVWLTLDDPAGADISTTTAAHINVGLPAIWLRPALSGGTAGTGGLTVLVVGGGLK